MRIAVVRTALLAMLAAPCVALAANHVVTMENFGFKPQTLTVKRGDTVEWVNKDILDHTSTSTSPGFDSKAIHPGGSWRWTAQRAGQYKYICTFHPTMTGVIEVQ
jgi:plastocyanin